MAASQAFQSADTASSQRHFYQSTFITGARIDNVCEKKEKSAAQQDITVRELE
jgi:hypothetical protein